jgi:hypothetical protein
MKKLLTITLSFFMTTMTQTQTQTPVSSPVGEYYLRGVMETGSGFKLNEDSTFQFFFTYGALDRPAEGTWSVADKTVVFNTRKKPLHDYALVSSSQTKSDSITISLPGSRDISRYMHCIIKGGAQEQQGNFGAEETVSFKAQPVESIELLFEFCPEKTSVFKIDTKGHNYFEFRFEPWMMELFFENFKLKVSEEGLTGAHPILEGDKYVYRKAGKR